MKKLLVVLTILAAFSATAQTPYTTMPDANHKDGIIYNGIITKYALENQPVFTWYGSSQSMYTPPADVLSAMTSAKDKVKFLLFGGTWCEDTQFVLPKFFKLQEQSGIPDTDVSFIAVDRQKKSLGNVASVFNITNVPTIIVLKDGKEVGRVVEYGKTGKWDAELAGLLK